ncbi:ABC transporter permease [Anaerotignum propionicum]|nr:ABC transporter permease [Anaerotignum propionicum]MCQ4937083.1 ABC transporter permease [Anaerotignum propionicum]
MFMWHKQKDTKFMSKEQAAFLNRLQRRKNAVHGIQWILLIGFFLLWEIAARVGWIDPFIFSQPSRMLSAGIQMGKDGTLWTHIGTTLWETVAGFVLGTILGTLTAILLWWNRFISDIAEPYLVVLNSLPKTALAPIIIVWLGNNQTSIIAVALLTSVIVTVMSVLNGFLQVDTEKIKLIQIFGGTKAQVLKKVVFPANIPCILNALKINVGLSFVGVIVGEFLVAQSGLGFLIVYGSQIFKLDWVMLSVIILAILAALMYEGIALLERKCLKWQQ